MLSALRFLAHVGTPLFIAAAMGSGAAVAVEPAALAASPLIVQPIAAVRPVVVADGSLRLIYELLLVNQSAFAVTLDTVAVHDAETGAVLKELTGTELDAALRLTLFGGAGTTLQPSQSAFLFVDVAVDATARLPAVLAHRIAASQSVPAAGTADAFIGGLPVSPDSGFEPHLSFAAPPVAVDATAAVVLAPPVRGADWVIFRGCCDVATSHRGGTGIYDGAVFIAERFAIDFIRIGPDRRLIAGPGDALSSYVQYGATVHAVADGTVVDARNDQPEQPPGSLPVITNELAGGNSVLLDIGGGRFAFYAHMQPGSIRVTVGDRVRSGDLIGLVGNSGRTIGPHLHFHVTDRPSSQIADGLPFVFSAFAGQGMLAGDALSLAFQGQPVPIDRSVLPGAHENQMPLNDQVVDFAE